jgi:DNA-binding transcriptional ArsR family regulator
VTTPPISAAPHEPRLASVASVIADATRARMLCYLLTGEYASAGELARAASVTAATASGHLGKLLDAELLVCEQRGRHRYFRIADQDVAHALEALALIGERRTHASSWSSPTRARLRLARCCYGHMAGKLGVELFSQLLEQQWLVPAVDNYLLTDAGKRALQDWGLDISSVTGKRSAYPCLDWSERRDHLAGKLPKALLDHFLQQGWMRRVEGERALEVTPVGRLRLIGVLPSLQSV